ncbi:MAG: hypothetical protein C4589_09000, partial [Peptococcaceae bacterium]
MKRKFLKTISMLVALCFMLSLTLSSAFAGNIKKDKKVEAGPPDKGEVTYTSGQLKIKSKPGELLVRFKDGKNISETGAKGQIAQMGGKV